MMSLGYNRPLYLLPFDHRQSYVTGMFHFTPPLTADEHAIVVASKQVVCDGFRQARVAKPSAGGWQRLRGVASEAAHGGVAQASAPEAATTES